MNHLSQADWNVLSVARHPATVTHTTTEVLVADVVDPGSVQRAMQEAEEIVEEVALWIYAMGDIASMKVARMPFGDWQRILAVNLSGAYLASHHSLRLLASDAHMVFLGAVSKRLRLPGLAAYASAKAGVEAFVNVLRKDHRGRRVALVRPKLVNTSLWEKVPFSKPPGATSPDQIAEAILQAYQEGHNGVSDL